MYRKKLFLDQSRKYYFDHPKIWEKLRARSIEKETNFLHQVFSKANAKNILDVGCGTGLHCAHLARFGYKTTGVDLNPRMIRYARKHYTNPKCKFLIGDMRKARKLNLNNDFDAIICLCTTFSYNRTTREIMLTLGNFFEMLKPKGILVLEVFNPISFLEKMRFMGSFFLEDKDLYQSLGLDLEVVHSINERGQLLIESKKFFDLRNKRKLLKQDKTEFRLFFPQEMRFYLKVSGFDVCEQYGKYDLQYTLLDSTRLITLAIKMYLTSTY